MLSKPNLKEYDEEPVEYCAKCYSLKIKHEERTDTNFCGDCGCTEIKTAPIERWEQLYEGRFGQKFVEKSTDPKKSKYFKMSLSSLKKELYGNKELNSLIRRLYPRFPLKYNREDLVHLLFDRLCKDNRLDDLRYLLYNQSKNQKNSTTL